MTVHVEICDRALTLAAVRVEPGLLARWLLGVAAREYLAVYRAGVWTDDASGRVVTDRAELAALDRARREASAARRLASMRRGDYPTH